MSLNEFNQRNGNGLVSDKYEHNMLLDDSHIDIVLITESDRSPVEHSGLQQTVQGRQ
jgi:hypothetical protein